MFEAILNNLE